VRKRKAKRQVDDDQVNNDASRAPEPDNRTGAQAEARPEATEPGTAEPDRAEPGTAEPEKDVTEKDVTEEAPEAAVTKKDEPEAAVTEEEPEAAEAAAPEAPEAPEDETTETTETTETAAESRAAEAAEAAAPAEAEGGEPRADAVASAREGEEDEEVGMAATPGDQGEAAEAEAAAATDAGEQDAGAQPDPAERPAEEAVVEPSLDEDSHEAAMAEVVAARAQADSYLDDLRRLQAEFDNYRKRTMREQTARIASASRALVTKLLPVLDNFELAVSHAEQSRDFDRMLKGIEMVFGELREVLSSEGLVSIEAEGKPFDPERHEAVVAVEQDGAEPGTVVDVIREGYEFNGRVLRPAMVKVAR
jgi:molecular chaperone GrpE